MAIVQIKDATVVQVNRTGFGVKVKEADREGADGTTYRGDRFTVWFKEAHGLSEGDVVSVSGFLGVKLGKPWAGRDGFERPLIELSVNRPELADSYASSQMEATTEDSWGSESSGFDGEVPF